MENVQETGLLIDYKEMPAYKGAKEKQEALLAQNPFIEITDNKTYEVAKQNRTALRQGRYDLQNGEKTIASRLKDFRELIKNETAKLIGITLTAEEKQQQEIERYEAEKAKEKEAALEAEKKRKEALRQQVYDFSTNKSKAIETATLSTIGAIITDIENSDLQLDEFTNDFLSAKNRLIGEAQRKQSQLQEDERLRVEREKAEEERRKLEEERKKLETERKKQEESIRKQREEEEAKIKKAKEEEESRLKEEREKLEVEKAELARLERERQEKEEAERKEKHAFMVNQRTERIKALGLDYDHDKKELFYNGRSIWLNFRIDDADDGTFTHETLPQVQEALDREKKRIELTKSDKQKLTEALKAFNPVDLFTMELSNDSAKVLMGDFISSLMKVKSEYEKLVDEL